MIIENITKQSLALNPRQEVDLLNKVNPTKRRLDAGGGDDDDERNLMSGMKSSSGNLIGITRRVGAGEEVGSAAQ